MLRKRTRSSILSRLPLPLSPFLPLSLSIILVVALTAWLAPCVVAQPLTVTHIRPASETDSRNAYFISLLDLVLAKTEGAYQLVPHETGMQQGRALKQLNNSGLFKMLSKQRIDYFPRSVLEIWEEADQHAEEGLVVEASIVLQYPAAIYFFVNKKNQALARRLEEGLRRAIADGSFDALFFERFGEVIRRARLAARTRFDLENPLLSSETPLDQPELWHQY